MTKSMIPWQIDKVKKMQDLESEVLTGIADALDFYEKHPEETISKSDLMFMRSMLQASATNLRLCGELISYWKMFVKDQEVR